MKNQLILLLAFVLLSTTQCSNEYETINLDSNVTISMPADFVLEDNSSSTSKKIYKAENSSDEIWIAVRNFSGIDTLSIEKKEKMVGSNLEGFVRSINGENVQKKKIQNIESMIQGEYSMEIEKNETSKTVFAKVVSKNTNIVILTYFTPQPTKKESTAIKDKIFQSIKID